MWRFTWAKDQLEKLINLFTLIKSLFFSNRTRYYLLMFDFSHESRDRKITPIIVDKLFYVPTICLIITEIINNLTQHIDFCDWPCL